MQSTSNCYISYLATWCVSEFITVFMLTMIAAKTWLTKLVNRILLHKLNN